MKRSPHSPEPISPQLPRIEIVTVGDEVLVGEIVNTNAAFLGKKLAEVGIDIGWMSVVGDNHEAITDAFTLAKSRSRAVIITGGLGPTPDDLTKPCLAEFMGDKIVFKKTLFDQVKERFKKMGKRFPAASLNQAEFPERAREIPNPYGTAAGIHYTGDNCEWFSLPGVPLEMRNMTENYVIPRLREIGMGGRIGIRMLRTCGIGESYLMEKLNDLDKASELVEVAFLPCFHGVDLKLTGRGDNIEDIDKRLNEAERLLMPDLASHLFASGNESLVDVTSRIARERGLKIAVAESCTGGLIAKMFTDLPGSSDIFYGGAVTYANEAKTEFVNVPAELIDRYGAVSDEVARAMAEGLRKRTGVDITAAVTGIAGPGGGTDEKPAGLTYIAVADKNGCTVQKFNFLWDRDVNRKRTAENAVRLLRDHMMNLDSAN